MQRVVSFSGLYSVVPRLAYIARLGVLLALAACASSPYEEGKSFADVVTNVNVIRLNDVYMATHSTAANGEPEREEDPSTNDQEALHATKMNVVSQLSNFGYTVTEEPHAPADIGMSFFIRYQPERWPLVSRSATVIGRVYDVKGASLFHMEENRNNETGNLLGNLLTAVGGTSRDEMIADATRSVVIKIVNEMRKGTKEKTPVRVTSFAHSEQESGR